MLGFSSISETPLSSLLQTTEEEPVVGKTHTWWQVYQDVWKEDQQRLALQRRQLAESLGELEKKPVIRTEVRKILSESKPAVSQPQLQPLRTLPVKPSVHIQQPVAVSIGSLLDSLSPLPPVPKITVQKIAKPAEVTKPVEAEKPDTDLEDILAIVYGLH